MEDIGLPDIENQPLGHLVDRCRNPAGEIGTAFAEAHRGAGPVGSENNNRNRNGPAWFSLRGSVEPTEIGAWLGDSSTLSTLHMNQTSPVQIPNLDDLKLLRLDTSCCERHSIINPARFQPDQRNL
jgi:hypothetical protein